MAPASRFMQNFYMSLGILLSMLLFSACATAADTSRQEKLAAPVIVIGDLHGDYDAYAAILQDAGLINKKGRWTGGEAKLVQVGDVPDRGPDTRKILDHLMKLEKQASRKGGEVIALIGNHEAMNVTGDLRYVTPEEYAAFKTSKSRKLRDTYFSNNRESFAQKYSTEEMVLEGDALRAAFEKDIPLGYVEHRLAWAPSGHYGAWVSSHDTLKIVDDSLFVHGGVSMDYVSMPIDGINTLIREALLTNPEADILNSETSPLWYRGNTTESEEGALEVDAVLEAFNVSRIIVGHTPQTKGITEFYDGKVIVVDTGISAYYDGTRSYLKIGPEGVTAVDNGESRMLEQRP